MVAKFVAEEGLLKGSTLSLEEGEEWVIGRDPDECQLVIEDPAASRKHMVCRSTPEGFIVENLSETNPILINNEAVTEPKFIQHGDLVTIGNGTYRFYVKEQAEINLETNGEEVEKMAGTIDETEEKRDSIFEEEEVVNEEQHLAEADIDLTETSHWLLKVIAGPNNGAEFGMEPENSYTLGTDPATCDIVFQDVSVSRQHAKITINSDETASLEDLGSSNGTLIEGEKVDKIVPLPPNTVISVGTSSFIIYNTEGESTTVVSPLLPAIARVIQESEKRREREESEKKLAEKEKVHVETPKTEPLPEPKKPSSSRLFLVGVAAAAFLILGFGITQLFRSEEVAMTKGDPAQEIDSILAKYPTVTYSFTKETGRLLLVGHILNNVDRNQLIYNLSILPFVKHLDDKIVVDEFIWGETNLVLAKNPNWRGITLHSPSAGKFVITGYLETREQEDALNDYLNTNFPYLDLLERRVVVEEDVESHIDTLLRESGIDEVKVSMDGGDVTLRGNVPYGSREKLDGIISNIKKINGIRSVKAFVVELPIEESVVNITDKYRVTGSSSFGKSISVVINGRILSEGDTLDGMVITGVTQTRITLQRGDVKYIIDYNQ